MRTQTKALAYFMMLCMIIPFCSLNAQQINYSAVDKTLSSLTINEKVSLLVGAKEVLSTEVETQNTSYAYTPAWAYSNALVKKKITPVTFANVNGGVASVNHSNLKTTAFPMPAVLAASWNKNLLMEVGVAIAKEAAGAGADVLVAPSANMMRNPLEGRNTEYFSEDPNLVAQLATAMLKGMQSQGIPVCLKYWCIDNQEANRTNVNVLLDQRTLREFYLRTFEKVVKECQPWGVLAAYPKINGVYQTEDAKLLNGVLRNQWQYKGVVLSDRYAGHDAVNQFLAGCDVLMPGSKAQYDALLEAVQSGKITEEQLDASVRRWIVAMMQTPTYNKSKRRQPDVKLHAELARQAARESIVLLKNIGECLPMKDERIKKIGFYGIGSYCFVQGDGSVNATEYTSLAQAFNQAGYTPDPTLFTVYQNYFNSLLPVEKKENSKPATTAKNKATNATSKTASKTASRTNTPQQTPAERMNQELSKIAACSFTSRPKELAFTKTSLQQYVKNSQVAVITICHTTTVGCDRKLLNGYQLSDVEVNMIHDVCAAYHKWGKKVIVVLNVDGMVDVSPWVEFPDAILWCGQAGQGGPAALADIIQGKVNPSGKLASLWPKAYHQIPSSANFPENYQGKSYSPKVGNNNPMTGYASVDETVFAEKMQIGYRYFDEHQDQVMYPFGYGLSYTTFTYDKMFVERKGDNVYVRVRVTNTGNVAGKESLQLYVSPKRKPNTIEKPLKILLDFTKTNVIKPGESQEVSLFFPLIDLSVYDERNSQWLLEKGNYTVKIGASSNNILTQYPLQIIKDQTYPLEQK